jgi:hypothetical protein
MVQDGEFAPTVATLQGVEGVGVEGRNQNDCGRRWVALGASASFVRTLDEVERCSSFSLFPLCQIRCRRSSSPRVGSGSSVLAEGLARGWTAVGTSSRSWRSLDEEVRNASSSTFSLLTALESPEQRAESGSRALPRRGGPGEGPVRSWDMCALVAVAGRGGEEPPPPFVDSFTRSRTRCPTPSVLLSCFLVNNNNKKNNTINSSSSSNNNNNNKYQSGASRESRSPSTTASSSTTHPSLTLWSSLPPAPLATPPCFPLGPQEARLFPILNITSQTLGGHMNEAQARMFMKDIANTRSRHITSNAAATTNTNYQLKRGINTTVRRTVSEYIIMMLPS